MRMIKVLCGLAALPLIAGVASAQQVKNSNDGKTLVKQPTQLSERQMDKVTAGWDFHFNEVDNTGFVGGSVYGRPNVVLAGTPATSSSPAVPDCAGCYLYIHNNALSIGSIIFGGPN